VVVIGAGLAGLTAADQLCAAGLEVEVVEARARVGGRLLTVESESPGGGWFDLGATWHWGGQPEVAALADGLGLTRFPQFDGGAALHDDPGRAPRRIETGDALGPAAFRLDGGCQALARRLADRLPAECVSLGVSASAVEASGSAVAVTVASTDGPASMPAADFVVVAVPPRLALEGIAFDPPLPGELVDVMAATPTWMADAVKCVVIYDRPFWRDAGLSGSAFSHAGPLHEVHDASAPPGTPAALWGLLSADPALRDIEPGGRVGLVLAQLERLFGREATKLVDYFERDWSSDPSTKELHDPGVGPLDYGHPVFRRPFLDGRLLWAGAETDDVAGGHMEGAVRSGRRAAEQVLARSG